MTDDDRQASEGDSAGSEPVKSKVPSESNTKPSVSRQLSISIRTMVIAVVITGLVTALGVMTWLYVGAQNKVDTQARQSHDYARAEKIAIDYAVKAAAMNYKDLNGWKLKLVEGTTPELKEKLINAAASMEQILVPLQWESTAEPLTAKVRSEISGIYTVGAFVGVLTKTVQAPEGLQSTATYSITVDGNNDWQISDVGGIGDVVAQK